MSPEETALSVIETSIKLPFVKVNREEFLVKQFRNTSVKATDLLEKGPEKLFSKKELDEIADKVISSNVLKSTSASFATGLPGGIAVAATIPADLAQFYGFVLKIAQEISYVYGYKSLFDENNELTDEAKNHLILFMGVMLGVTAAGSTIRVASIQASKTALQQIPKQALTKTTFYPILKKVLKIFGIKLTKSTFGKGISKIIPVVGGVVSGSLNYASMKPMAKNLKNELGKIVDYTEEDYLKDIEVVEKNIK